MSRPPARCLHELVERQAAKTPDLIALRFDGGTMTYGELDRRAAVLAAGLRERGIRRDSMVAVACERSPHMIVALLGVMKSGGAYVPLDLNAPAARLADVLGQCGNPLVVTTVAARGTVPWVGDGEVIYADRLDERRPVPRTARVGPRDLVYVIFTSGSTGSPKGVMMEHAPVVNRLRWMMANHRLGPGDRVLQKTPTFFDVSVWEIFWPLSVGATLVLARPEGHRDADYLVRLIIETGITVVHFVPSMLHAFLEHPHVSQCTSLTRVYCSGETLPPVLQERFFARLDARLYNMYGPTETAIEVTAWTCVPGSPTVPIGYPIDNVRLYVLDGRQQPVPDGQPGELVIGGLQVARGYLGRPDLTAALFLNDPFARPGERMYRSGDQVWRRADGAFEYIGRLDGQVKLRGQRIELGEVEACMHGHPSVSRAVAAVKSVAEADQRLVGYALPVPGANAAGLDAALRAHLTERLPGYMVPSAFVLVDSIPVTASGKADRKALPDPLTVTTNRTAPRPGLETRLAAVWADVLRRSPGREDRFLDSGGNSLLATVLAARITYELGIPITIGQVFAAGSLADLADAAAQADQAAGPAGPGSAAPAGPGFPVARSLDELRLERIELMGIAEVEELLTELEGFL